jgi:hypothetical protein
MSSGLETPYNYSWSILPNSRQEVQRRAILLRDGGGSEEDAFAYSFIYL